MIDIYLDDRWINTRRSTRHKKDKIKLHTEVTLLALATSSLSAFTASRSICFSFAHEFCNASMLVGSLPLSWYEVTRLAIFSASLCSSFSRDCGSKTTSCENAKHSFNLQLLCRDKTRDCPNFPGKYTYRRVVKRDSLLARRWTPTFAFKS